MKYQRSSLEWVFDIVNHVFLGVLALSMLYPFVNVLAISLSSPNGALHMGLGVVPIEPTIGAYKKVLTEGFMGRAYLNTIIRTVIGTVVNLLASFSVAFVMSKRDLPYRNMLTVFFVFTMYFSGGLVPSYLLIKDLGLMNTMGALIIPGIYSTWNMIMIRNYLASIPYDLTEAALIDGASPFRIMWIIIFPLATPILATVAMWNAVGNWNAWFDAMIYIQDNAKQVLQVILRRITIMEQLRTIMPTLDRMVQGMTDYSELTLKSATIMLTIGPIIFVYPFAQKYYIKGIIMGSLKG
jgi:putative aldouronate transport system permease protein